jgi:hypothetical protein
VQYLNTGDILNSRRMRRAVHVAHMEMTNTYKILIRKPEENRGFGRNMCRSEVNIKI